MKKGRITVIGLVGIGLALAACSPDGQDRVNGMIEAVKEGELKDKWEQFSTWGKTTGEALYDSSEFDPSAADMFDPGREIKSGSFESYCLGNSFTSIKLENAGTRTKFQLSPDDSVYAAGTMVGKFQGFAENGTLFLKTATTAKMEEMKSDWGLVILLPETIYWQQAVLEVGIGEVSVESLKGNKVEFQVGAGSLQVEKLEAEEWKADVGMGKLEANCNLLKVADLDCTLGSMKIQFQGAKEEFNYHLGAAAGKLVIDSQDAGELAKESRIENGASKGIDIMCSLGRVELSFTE